MCSKSVLAGYAAGSLLLLAAAPAWAQNSNPVAEALRSPPAVAQASHPACPDWRTDIAARIEQFRQRCLAVRDPGRAAACDAEQRTVVQDVGHYNSQCGR